MSSLLRDFLGETLSLESRLFRSLWSLFFRPGFLTEEYLAGRRASQLPPIRLYLVASLFFFFLFSLTPPDVSNSNVYVGEQLVGREEPDPNAGNFGLDMGTDGEGLPWLRERMKQQEERFLQMDPQELVDTLYRSITSNLPKALILFLPLLALLLKLLFLFSRILYFDHFIFALHLQAFFFCLFSFTWVLPVPAIFWLVFFVLVAPIYLFVALRRVYRQSRLWSLLKTVLLIITYLFVFLTVLTFLGIYVVTTV